MSLSRRTLLGSVGPLAMALAVGSCGPSGPAGELDLTRRLAAVADTLLPAGSGPGALAVGVPDFVAMLFRDSLEPSDQTAILAALDALDRLADEQGVPRFAELPPALRASGLSAVQQAALAAGPAATGPDRGQLLLREFLLHAYFTSQLTDGREVRNEPIHGAYKDCVPMQASDIAFARPIGL